MSHWNAQIIKKGDVPGTPTARHQFDVSPVDEPLLVSGLTAKCDVLRLVEGHLALHLSGLTFLNEADVGLDAHNFWIWDQRMPHGCLVAAPAAGQEISGMSPQTSEQTDNIQKQRKCLCMVSPLVFGTGHFRNERGTYLSMLSQLYHFMVGVGTPSATQVTKCLLPGRWWSVRSLIWEGTTPMGEQRSLITSDTDKNKSLSSTFLLLQIMFKNQDCCSRTSNTHNALTLNFKVKGHFLCVISICDKDSVEAFLIRPHPY